MSTVRRGGTALLLVAVLTGLPLGGTVCAVLCATTPGAPSAGHDHDSGHHHESAATGHHDAAPPQQPEIAGQSGADCMDHCVGAVGDALRASRADESVARNGLAPSAQRTFVSVTTTLEHIRYRPPPATSALTRAPLVLRI